MTPTQIRELMTRLDLKTAELAARVGVSTAAVRSWRSGRRTPHGPAARALEALTRGEAAPGAAGHAEKPPDVETGTREEIGPENEAGEAAPGDELRGRLVALAVERDATRGERDTARQELDALRDGLRGLVWADHDPAICTCVRCNTLKSVRELFLPADTKG